MIDYTVKMGAAKYSVHARNDSEARSIARARYHQDYGTYQTPIAIITARQQSCFTEGLDARE